ncbi:hypothetical protein U1Q18_029245 [Sarracenia purpurea var. burkii]
MLLGGTGSSTKVTARWDWSYSSARKKLSSEFTKFQKNLAAHYQEAETVIGFGLLGVESNATGLVGVAVVVLEGVIAPFKGASELHAASLLVASGLGF